jgi:Large eukaryotic DNA virus major capsid protein/Major capsid protein N-terminus
MQLVAYGAQDVYLTGNPKVTFFQAVYKRHTNFAMENIQQTVNGSAASGGRVSVTVARNGDLIGEMYVQLQANSCNTFSGLSTTFAAGSQDGCWLAERAIADIELSIGGQRIDKHYQRWWRLYSELFLDDAKKANYAKMTSNPTGEAYVAGGNNGATSGEVFLPLIFFFNRNAGLYLPLIALQYHEVRLDFDLSQEYTTCFKGFNVWGNYVYLDTEERRRFAQKGHEYLIEQVQHTGTDTILTSTSGVTGTSAGAQIRLSYNHPVKELIWCVTNGNSAGKTLWDFCSNAASSSGVYLTMNSNVALTAGAGSANVMSSVPIAYGTGTPLMVSGNTFTYTKTSTIASYWTEDGAPVAGREVGPLASFRLILNGQDRMKDQSGKYFNQIEPFWHHSGNPYPGVYAYSFALKPEEHQPTGTCNFSRIDNAQVDVRIKAGLAPAEAGTTLDMYAVNYNVLRIQSGMGGLAFSN